jgi:poly(3-hydroxyalkanoate) depolymerase
MSMADARVRRFDVERARILGRHLRIARWRSDQRRLSNRPLLFFNGIGANAEVMAPLVDRLADRDVVMFDMPGVGGSPLSRTPYRPWMMARIADRIMSRFGYGPVDVMGVSWGGVLAQQFAFQFAARTARQVLVATSPGAIMAPGRLSSVTKMLTPRRYSDPAYLHRHAKLIYGGGLSDALAAFHAAMRPPTASGYLQQLVATAGWTSLPLLPFISAPTLILMGGDDRIVRPINGRILQRLIRNSRLKVLDDAGHLLLLTHADRAAGLITDFLDEPADQARSAQGSRSAASS